MAGVSFLSVMRPVPPEDKVLLFVLSMCTVTIAFIAILWGVS